MSLLRFLAPLVVFCLTCGSSLAQPQSSTKISPEQITYLTEDYPPSNYVEDGVVKGYAVEVLQAMWKHMGVAEQPIEVTNWARAYNQTQSTPNTMLFATTRNAEREDKFQWVGPIYMNRYVLIGRSGKKFPITRVADAAQFRIGVIREDIGHKLMLENGFSDAKLDRVADFRQLVKMLANDRVDLICVSATLIPGFAKYGGLDVAQLQTVLTVKETSLYYAYNKATDAQLVARFQSALKAVEPTRKKRLIAAGLTP